MAITEQKRRRAASLAILERFLIRVKRRADRLFSWPGLLVSRITANTAIRTAAKIRLLRLKCSKPDSRLGGRGNGGSQLLVDAGEYRHYLCKQNKQDG